MAYTTILFDLDGTLVDSGEGVLKCAELALRHFNLPIPSPAEMRTTKPEDFINVQKYLADVLGEPEQAELTWLPNMPMDLDDEAYAKIEKLVDALDANDDVQKVFTAAA